MSGSGVARVICIDGPAGSGKSTLAARLAAHFQLPFLDTGLLYRAVARRMLDRGLDVADPAAAEREALALEPADVSGPCLRDDAVGQGASKVAAFPAVRAALLPFQRRFAEQPGGAVLAGRDTGTVVCPQAPHKLYVTASVEARARRRFLELQARGLAPIEARVLDEMRERDRRDQGREVAPLAVAPDATVIDTTDLDADAAFRAALDAIGKNASVERPVVQP